METVTISKEEYDHLKQLEQLDFDLIRQFSSSKHFNFRSNYLSRFYI